MYVLLCIKGRGVLDGKKTRLKKTGQDSFQSFNYSTKSKVRVLDTRNVLLNTNIRLVLASRRVTWCSDKIDPPEYLSSNSNTQYDFLIQQSIRDHQN